MTSLWNISGTQPNDISVLEPMVKQDITHVVGFSELRSQLQNHNMLQFFINGIFRADAYQIGSTTPQWCEPCLN